MVSNWTWVSTRSLSRKEGGNSLEFVLPFHVKIHRLEWPRPCPRPRRDRDVEDSMSVYDENGGHVSGPHLRGLTRKQGCVQPRKTHTLPGTPDGGRSQWIQGLGGESIRFPYFKRLDTLRRLWVSGTGYEPWQKLKYGRRTSVLGRRPT